MSNEPEFQQMQRQFLNYLRQPQAAKVPVGFAPERLAIYSELLYNKFDESLTTCFPVLHSILARDSWRTLVLDFIAGHRCLSPYYRQIPDEFVQYLHQERANPGDLPFLSELAHFEWMELQLSIAEAEPVTITPLSDAQLLSGVPVFAPVMQLLHYHWPVQEISPAFLPEETPAALTHILGFRDSDDHVQFIALNPATAQLVMLLQKGLSGQQALQEMKGELTDEQFIELTLSGRQILADLHHQGTIIDILPA
jgi:uncharacterized protein